MYDSLRKIFKPFIICILIFLGDSRHVPAQPLLNDSLRLYLMHFREKTIDNDFKKAVEKVLAILPGDTLNDSIVSNLINVEELLTNAIEENQLINFRPFNPQIVFSFGEKLVSLFQQSPLKKENHCYASALNNLGVLYSSLGQWQKGNVLIEKALNIRKKNLSEEHPEYAESLINVANVYWSKGNKKQALDLAESALIITKKEGIKFHINHAKCLFFLATAYKDMFKYDIAAKFYDEELIERKKIHGEENAYYALRLYRTGDMFEYLWQYDKSLLLFQQAIDLTKKTLGEKSLQYAFCLEALGSVYYHTSQYIKAISFYEQSLAIKEQLFGKDYSDNALSLQNLANTYQQMGDYSNALPLFQRASEIAKKALANGLELDFNYAFSLNYIAFLYQAMGQYSEALPLLQNALAITKKSLGEEHPFYARDLNNLAVLYENMHRYNTALYYYQKVLKIRRKILGEAHPEYATSLDNLACLYKKMGKYDIAIQLCRQGLEIRKNKLGERSPAYATSLNSLGELYMYQRKYDTAAVLLRQSLNIRKHVLGHENPDYVKSLNSLGLLNMATGSNTNAAALFAEANNIELKHIWHTYTSLSEQEKLNLINKEYLQFSYLPSLLYKNSKISSAILQQVYGNEIALKGMVLDDQKEMLKSIRQSGDSLALRQYEQWRFNKAFLGNQFLLPAAKRISYFQSLEENTNQLEQQLSRSSVAFLNHQQTQSITTSDIFNKLVKGEAAIEFIKFQLYNKKWTDSIIYAALLLLPGDSIPKFIPLFEEKKLRNLLQSSTVNQLYPVTNNLSNSTAKRSSLFNLIWKPLEKYLTGVKKVNYAPTGLLHRIAFQALSYDSSNLLIDKYQLTQLLNTAYLASQSQTSKPGSIILWGNIQYDFQTNNPDSKTYAGTQNGKLTKVNPYTKLITSTFNFYTSDTRHLRGNKFGKLPGTKLEIQNINDLFLNKGINALRESDTIATEEAFKALDGKSPPIIHLATHGFFLPVKKDKSKNTSTDNSFTIQENPMFRSGLVLAGGNPAWKGEQTMAGKEDGILTAYEIAQMDLSNTNLVVLSACNTALGDIEGNEGVIGLQRAFKMEV